jgi:uncharacterized membrane protein
MRSPFSPLHLFTFVMVLVLLLAFIQLELVKIAFEKLGLSTSQGMLLLFASLFGSAINLPFTSIRAELPEVPAEPLVQRSLLRMPVIPFAGRTIIAINVGGCLVPLVFSASLIHHFPFSMGELALAIGLVTAVCHFLSRPVPGLGIGMPPLVAPIAAAIVAITLDRVLAAPLAYVCGTMGVLLGADLLRLKDVSKIGAPIVSIGGAGTFDGIFLTGIVAVLLT